MENESPLKLEYQIEKVIKNQINGMIQIISNGNKLLGCEKRQNGWKLKEIVTYCHVPFLPSKISLGTISSKIN